MNGGGAHNMPYIFNCAIMNDKQLRYEGKYDRMKAVKRSK